MNLHEEFGGLVIVALLFTAFFSIAMSLLAKPERMPWRIA